MKNNSKDMGLEARIERLEKSLQYLKKLMATATEVTKGYEVTDSGTTDSTSILTYVDFETPIEDVGVSEFTVKFLKKRNLHTVGDALIKIRSYEGTSYYDTEIGCAKRVIRTLTDNGFSIDNKAFLDYIEKYYAGRLKKCIENHLEEMNSSN